MEKPETQEQLMPDPALRDLAWAGFSARAAAPAIGLAAIATVLVLSGRWYLTGLSELADRVGALAIFALAAAVWPLVLALLVYRSISYTYRLTDRALLVDFGYLSRPVAPIPLWEVANVSITGGSLMRWLDVGSVRVVTATESLRLKGLRNPQAFAEQIERARAAAKTLG